MSQSYIGQWKGKSENGSFVLVNIAQDNDTLTGRVSIYEVAQVDDKSISFWTWSYFDSQLVNENRIEGKVYPPSIHSKFGERLTDAELNELKQKTGLAFPVSTKFIGVRQGEYSLEVEWSSVYPDGSTRQDKGLLKKERLGSSKVTHEEMKWNHFKEYALEQKDGLIYRGQARHWSLRTSYHRTGHADLISYLDDIIPEVEHHINAVSDHLYNAHDDRSLGALLNLVQHHGYPTPLLDWTKSPYVAAFFAFENESRLKKGGNVSVFEFDEKAWAKMAGRSAQTRVPNMVLRTLELPGFGNSRVLPQQSLTMYSNVDNIEEIIQSHEKTPGQLIKAVSIPTSDRKAAMRDLSLMGITWGSMFPGFDGVCKQLRARHF